MSDARLAELAAAVGLQLDWQDANGRPQRVDPEVQRGLLEALGYPAQSPQQIEQSLAALARLREDSANLGLLVGECGQPLEQALGPAGTPGELVYEDGTRIALRLDAEGRLPAQARSGYAQLSLEQREWAVAMAPPSCPSLASLAPGRSRRWGLAAQVYALRRPGDGGLGDSAALEDLLRSAARHGADALAISPLHALAEANGHAYSPYSPSSRLFFNVLHAAPATILGAAAVEQAIRRAGLAAEMARLESLELIDWTAAADLRMRLLRQLHRDFTERASPLRHDLAEFRREAGEALLHHCRFETLQAHLGAGPDWRRWPEPLRRPGEPAVAEFCADHAEEVDFRAFGQWLTQRCLQHAQRQAREAGMAIGLVADLAVGADGGGSQAWSRQEELLAEVNVGAPPDILNQSGQDWGVSAFNPEGLRRHGYRAFREMLRANLAWPGGLRIDHVMGLQRLWLIPRGQPPHAGAYLRYPQRELLRLLALEASRASALVIGEDLGTVPEGLREELARRQVLGTRVLLFERRGERFVPPAQWPADAMATTSTHDLPSLSGWWRGQDIHWRGRAGHRSAEECAADLELRAEERRALAASLEPPVDPDPAAEVPLDACIGYVGATPRRWCYCPWKTPWAAWSSRTCPAPATPTRTGGGAGRKTPRRCSERRRSTGACACSNAAAGMPRRPPMIEPRATLRLQFHAGFTLDDALPWLDYFADLGISHLYASPLFRARPGSSHGYDVVDPTRINPELGGEPALLRLIQGLRQRGMGLLMDIVPNHMGIGGGANPWWQDVLEWGRESPYASFFDIQWESHDAALRGQVLLPFLRSDYGEVLAAGEIGLSLDREAGRLLASHGEQRFPSGRAVTRSCWKTAASRACQPWPAVSASAGRTARPCARCSVNWRLRSPRALRAQPSSARWANSRNATRRLANACTACSRRSTTAWPVGAPRRTTSTGAVSSTSANWSACGSSAARCSRPCTARSSSCSRTVCSMACASITSTAWPIRAAIADACAAAASGSAPVAAARRCCCTLRRSSVARSACPRIGCATAPPATTS